MPKLLVLQHVAFAILGTLNPHLKDAGFRLRYVNFGRHPDAEPKLDGYQGLVILGGPMGVNEVGAHPHLLTELRLIETAMEREMPILGVCLGAQLIAQALGAHVRANPEKEIGWYDVTLTDKGRSDPLFRHFRPTEKLFQWHADAFDVPRSATHLASTTTCRNQAFRYGTNVYALQFHLEVDESLVERWLHVLLERGELEEFGGKISREQIRRETGCYVERLRWLSDSTFAEFIRLFGLRRRYRALPSR